MGIRITGNNVMVFKNEKGAYSTSISNKQLDGTYINSYITLQFKKGVELENKTRITIKDAFLTFFKLDDGRTIYKIVVLDFEQEGDAKEPEVGFETKASDLPF